MVIVSRKMHRSIPFILIVVLAFSGCGGLFKVEITDCIVSIADFQLDDVEIERIEILLEGGGADSIRLCVDGKEHIAQVRDNKAVVHCGWPGCIAKRAPTQDSFTIAVSALSSSGRVMATKTFEKSISIVGMGDTVPNVEQEISWTPLWWRESQIAVDGPYSSGFYTFTARPGMKFVILAYRFVNNGTRSEYTPYLSAGEIITAKGYVYSLWDPPVGIWSEEYSPRKSTPREIDELIGRSGGYEELLPGRTVMGCTAFEIPEDEQSLEVKLFALLPLISLK